MNVIVQTYRQQLARQIKLPENSSWPLMPLALALVDEFEASTSCERCQDLLPEYVQAEIGQMLDPADSEQAWVQRHVLACPQCGRHHAQLLGISWLLVHDGLPQASKRPKPRFPWRTD